MEASKETQTVPGVLRESESSSSMAGDLVRRAQNGDRTAISSLYLNHHEQIYRFIWSRVHDPAQADDLTGEVFLRMIISLQKYQDRSIPFRAWLYRIARNLLLDSHRRLKFRSPLPLEAAVEYPVDTVSPERAAEHTLTLEKVSRALERLAPNQREVVELRFLAGLDLEEVAEVIDKSVSAVKGLQHRGLTAIRDILKE